MKETKEKPTAVPGQAKPVVMPVCPYCGVKLRPVMYRGYYDSFPMWECDCEELPGAEKQNGMYA